MSKTFIVEITVSDSVPESRFGMAIVKAIQDQDALHLNYLTHNVIDITVRPYEEPRREWEVTFDCLNHTGCQEGFFGTESEIRDMAIKKHPFWPIVGYRIKD